MKLAMIDKRPAASFAGHILCGENELQVFRCELFAHAGLMAAVEEFLVSIAEDVHLVRVRLFPPSALRSMLTTIIFQYTTGLHIYYVHIICPHV